MKSSIKKTEEDWKKILTKEQFYILRKKGTERPFTGKYWDNHQKGTYYCAGCGNPLFDSETKFDSGTGWPSFFAPIENSSIETKTDYSHGIIRTEASCSKCKGHLGHIFDDGPPPTNMRYCMNSDALKFKPKESS
ncbi:MAG: peptide-methionine (R)-S-oxide reductase MsrB [Promethearchaeota archaeon]